MGTAGKAVLFSGIAVAVGLSGLLWFEAAGLSSIGLGGAIVVVASVFYSLVFLPAILGMLGHRVNSLSVAALLRRARPAPRRPGRSRGPRAGSRSRTGSCATRSRCSCRRWRSCWSSARRSCGLKQGIPDATVMPGGRREPRCLGRAPDGVPRRRDDADHRPARHEGRSHRPRTRSRARCRWPRSSARSRESIGSRDRSRSRTRPPARPMTDAELAQVYAADPATLPPDLAAGLAALRDDLHPRPHHPPRRDQPPQLRRAGRNGGRLEGPRGGPRPGDGADAGRRWRCARRGLPPQPGRQHPVGRRDDAAGLGDHPVPAVRVARDPDQGRPDDPALADRELRRAGLDLPGGQPPRAARRSSRWATPSPATRSSCSRS